MTSHIVNIPSMHAFWAIGSISESQLVIYVPTHIFRCTCLSQAWQMHAWQFIIAVLLICDNTCVCNLSFNRHLLLFAVSLHTELPSEILHPRKCCSPRRLSFLIRNKEKRGLCVETAGCLCSRLATNMMGIKITWIEVRNSRDDQIYLGDYGEDHPVGESWSCLRIAQVNCKYRSTFQQHWV